MGGQYYYKTAIMMREALLVNGILFNSEVWYNISEKELRELEEVDETFLRRILKAHSKTPIEAFYLELGCIPLRYIIMSRRVNFLYYLTNLKHDEMLYKFFQAQVISPIKNDCIVTVNENLNHLKIHVTSEDIEGKSKGIFKKEIKTKIQLAALKYLKDKASGHSKMEKLEYKKLSLQSYLYSIFSVNLKLNNY